MYDYKILILDTNGNKYHYNAEDYGSQFHAIVDAEEWVAEGGVRVDSITILETNDPRTMGVWSPNNG